MTANAQISATQQNTNKMNQLQNIYYCNVCNSVYDTHGKEYEIKEHRNWKFINVGNKKVGLSTLPVKLRIRNFDDFVFLYVFEGLFVKAPCLAMDYFVYRNMTNKNISIKQFLEHNKNNPCK